MRDEENSAKKKKEKEGKILKDEDCLRKKKAMATEKNPKKNHTYIISRALANAKIFRRTRLVLRGSICDNDSSRRRTCACGRKNARATAIDCANPPEIFAPTC